jgi:hypothetical protein
MKKITYVSILALIAAVMLIPMLSGAKKVTASMTNIDNIATPKVVIDTVVAEEDYASLYESLELDKKGLDRNTFDIAITGYNKLSDAGKIKNNKLSIVDFSQPSTKKRLYIIDMAAKKLLFHTLVAHGKNSGDIIPKRFSNTNESLQSSLGFYVTAEKYQGKHGLSMRMDGVEKTNSNARARAIVVHGANYVSEQFVKSTGYLGRSWGCPAVNPELNEPIINAIGNGSALFIYSPQADYVAQSSLITR